MENKVEELMRQFIKECNYLDKLYDPDVVTDDYKLGESIRWWLRNHVDTEDPDFDIFIYIECFLRLMEGLQDYQKDK